MSTELRFHGDAVAAHGMLDFAVNVWPGARPPGLQVALEAALGSDRYPDDHAAREAIARRHGREPAEVLLGNGACDLFWLLADALRPETAACVHPSFTEPEAALRNVGADVARVPRAAGWALDVQSVPEHVEVVVVGNPNNPTGTLDPADLVACLAQPGRLLVVDESFMDFVPDETESLASRRDVPGLVVVRSLTKLWSLPAVRAGYLLGEPALVSRLAAHRQAWPVNGLACAALEWCAGDRETPVAVAAEVAVERARLCAGLAACGLDVSPAAANFVLVTAPDGPRLLEGLRDRGIAVRPAESFPGLDRSHLRVAVRRREDNDRLLAAVADVFG
jgi:histidinol-phosphate aminotransferase